MKTLLTVALRQQALYIPKVSSQSATLHKETLLLVSQMAKIGFAVSEPLLYALNGVENGTQNIILDSLYEITGMKKNWTPLVKGWNHPTNESLFDHIATWFATLYPNVKGTTLACGHLIPNHTFPLERYNGCPFCGTPFEQHEIEKIGQGSKLKVLNLWTDAEMQTFLNDLIQSKTPLDATQVESLKTLLAHYKPAHVSVGMKETQMVLMDYFMQMGNPFDAQPFITTANDILRFLWYQKTGFLQIIPPKTLILKEGKLYSGVYRGRKNPNEIMAAKKESLKLHYRRKEGIIVAQWLNELNGEVAQICEQMHPKRQMWIRFIRALRLAEFSKKKGFEKLNHILDSFYKKDYTVWQGKVDTHRLKQDADTTLALLKQRPGLFARSLFANILWFGAKKTLAAFDEITHKVPARLLLTLEMYAETYFDPSHKRSVSPLGGNTKMIPTHPLVQALSTADIHFIKQEVRKSCVLALKKRFAQIVPNYQSIYIAPELYRIPLAIGDRSQNVQDLSAALQGTRFLVEGDKVRLFMQWGTGLPAGHYDMDLSASIIYGDHSTQCSYFNLSPKGANHSGDIRAIPDQIGTAEYIELDLPILTREKVKYVAFTCNAFSGGEISKTLSVGWMNAKHPMHISPKTGVAYDPSCVQHQVRVSNSGQKGLCFGVLKIATKEIIWLEMPFHGQTVLNMSNKGIEALMAKLDHKLSIGAVLFAQAEAQALNLAQYPEEADKVFDVEWSRNIAQVTQQIMVE